MSGPRLLVARAFAPGHVTGIFRPETAYRDPRARGSVGAGVVLELGAWAEVRFSPGARSRVRVEAGDPGSWPISEDVARRLAPRTPGTLTVRLSHDLPVGQGFGMSAAGALATALAVGFVSGRPRARAIEVAHLAELFGGGGLGGVAAILGGGLEVRTRPGIPPFGKVAHFEFPPALIVGVVGRPIPSPSMLRDPRALRAIAEAARGFERFALRPSASAFLRLSERFTDRVGLASSDVTRVVSELRRRGASACQAMFGESFFAVPRSDSVRAACLAWLEREGFRAVEIRAARAGAHLVRAGPREGVRPPTHVVRAPQAF